MNERVASLPGSGYHAFILGKSVMMPAMARYESSNLYIAGQTAPGEGITVYGNGVSFSGANNIICRYLRVRMGKNGDGGKDCAGVSNGTNMIFDHCSFSWGLDETFSINSDNKGTLGDITLQNCIFGQGLLPHSAGGLMQADHITLYITITQHFCGRCP